MKYMIQREIPVVGEYDVVVTGGGFGGFGAACAAARNGVKVLIIERFAQLGGMGSVGGVGNFCYHGPMISHGSIFDEVIEKLRRMKVYGRENGYNPVINTTYQIADNLTDHNVIPIVLQDIAENSGVQLLFHTEVIDVVKEGSRIDAVIIHNASGTQAIRAKVFIDGTGTGITAQHAGAKVLDIHDERHPEMIRASTLMYLRKVDTEQLQAVLDESCCDEEKDIPKIQYWEEADGKIAFKVHMKHSYDTGSGLGLSALEQEMRRKVPAFVRYFQRKVNPYYKFDYVPPLMGFREGRRIQGDYVLTIDDLKGPQTFTDAIAYGNFTVDTVSVRENMPYYQIPMRSLWVKGIDNMFVVGRCLSADRLAMSAVRIMPTCCLMGQAAGIAAALACKQCMDIRKVDTAKVVELLVSDSAEREVMLKKLRPDAYE